MCLSTVHEKEVHKECCIPLIKAFVFCNILGVCAHSGWSSHVNVMEHDDFLLWVPERENKMGKDAEKRPNNTRKKKKKGSMREMFCQRSMVV